MAGSLRHAAGDSSLVGDSKTPEGTLVCGMDENELDTAEAGYKSCVEKYQEYRDGLSSGS